MPAPPAVGPSATRGGGRPAARIRDPSSAPGSSMAVARDGARQPTHLRRDVITQALARRAESAADRDVSARTGDTSRVLRSRWPGSVKGSTGQTGASDWRAVQEGPDHRIVQSRMYHLPEDLRPQSRPQSRSSRFQRPEKRGKSGRENARLHVSWPVRSPAPLRTPRFSVLCSSTNRMPQLRNLVNAPIPTPRGILTPSPLRPRT